MNGHQQSATSSSNPQSRSFGNRSVHRRHTKGSPYEPGFADHLLTPKDHLRPEEISGVSFEISSAGAMVVIQHRKSGGPPIRNILRSTPFEVCMALPDGELMYLELSSLGRPEEPSEEEIAEMLAGGYSDGDGEPEDLIVGYRTPEEIAAAAVFVAVSLWEFGNLE